MGNKKTRGKAAVRLTALFCAACVTLFMPGSAFEKTAAGTTEIDKLRNEIEKQQKENEKRQQQIESYEGDIADNEEAMGVVSEQIDGVNNEITKYGQLILAKEDNIETKKIEIADVEQTIADKEEEIENKKDEIARLQAENKQNLRKFAKLARALYMSDSSGSMPILNGSDDWYNYFVYSDVVKNISGQNTRFMERLLDDIKRQEKMISDLNRDIENLELEKESLKNQKEKLEDDMDELEREKGDLEDYAAERKNYLYGLASENENMRDKIDGLNYSIALSQSKMDDMERELAELIRKAQEEGSGSQIAYTDGFRWPLSTMYQNIICYYGYDAWRGGNHGGIDIIGSGVSVSGANIYAAQSGTVILSSFTCSHDYGKYYSCGCGGGFGNYIIVDHGGGLSTLYAHCRAIYVTQGQQVNKGDIIGLVGSTGWSTGEHLHFEVRVNGGRVNPLSYDYQKV